MCTLLISILDKVWDFMVWDCNIWGNVIVYFSQPMCKLLTMMVNRVYWVDVYSIAIFGMFGIFFLNKSATS